MGARPRRDAYGNIYWYEDSYSYDRYVTVQPVEPSDLLEVRPDGLWRGLCRRAFGRRSIRRSRSST